MASEHPRSTRRSAAGAVSGRRAPHAGVVSRWARPLVPSAQPGGRAPGEGFSRDHNAAMAGHVLYLVGGAPRVGKSSLAQRLLAVDGIPWLPTDVLRTVLRRVLPELDAVDQDPVDASLLAEVMYPHVEQAAEVCVEEADRFLIEGFELAPYYPGRLRAALAGIEVRACFLGHGSFSIADLAGYRGPKPQHHGASRHDLGEAAGWIRRRSQRLRDECGQAGVPNVEVGEVSFEAVMIDARRHLLGDG